MRRLFIIRKDLNLSAGKLAAMCSHCSEEYFMTLLRNGYRERLYTNNCIEDQITIKIPAMIFDEYINNSYVKTICEAKNLHHLNNAAAKAKELGLVEEKDFGFINDKCLTELAPENENGTCTVGIWFAPLTEDISHQISKKYQLYRE